METTYYYYHRDAENKPRITVCLLKANGDIARGVAICSLSDNPCKKTGRKIACDRAIYAMKSQKDGCMARSHKAFSALPGYCFPPMEFPFYKAEYNPIPTDFESKLIDTAGCG